MSGLVALALLTASTVYATVWTPPSGATAQGSSTAQGPSPPALKPLAADPQAADAGAAKPADGEPLVRDGDVIPARRAAPIGPQLESRINAVIAAHSRYEVGVAMVDVSEGAVDDAVHEFGVQSGFVAASTAKILAAAAFYQLEESGQVSLADPMGYSTAGAQIRQMVQQSNNESWALVLGVLGRQGLSDYAASIGITYDRSVNVITPADMARTLALLYTGRLLNPQNTAQLLSYMQNTNYETLLPAAVPPGVGVFHKYGLLSANLHDAGILVQDGEAFVLVVYTRGRGLSDLESRATVIREIAGTVAEALF